MALTTVTPELPRARKRVAKWKKPYCPVTPNNSKVIGDIHGGELWYYKQMIMRWDRTHVWFFPAGGARWMQGAGYCTIKRWRQMAAHLDLAFYPLNRSYKLKLWLWRKQTLAPFKAGKCYARDGSNISPVMRMAAQKREKHYDQTPMPPVAKWSERKPGYVKTVLLARRKMGVVVIQVMQYGDDDFYYEAIIPSPFRFAKNNILARARFRSYDRAVQAFGADHVTLLEPMTREQVHIDREELPFSD